MPGPGPCPACRAPALLQPCPQCTLTTAGKLGTQLPAASGWAQKTGGESPGFLLALQVGSAFKSLPVCRWGNPEPIEVQRPATASPRGHWAVESGCGLGVCL